MKISCILENLKNAVALAERSSAKNQSLPVLNSIYLNGENGKVTLRSTNLETALEINLPAKIEESGSIVVSAKVLNSFLSNIKGDKVILQNQKDNLLVKTDNSKTVLRGYPKDEFPLFPKVDKGVSFSLSPEELINIIESVAPAASLSDIKPELSSLFFRLFKNTLKVAATDSFRLAEKTIMSKNFNSDSSVSILVPSRAAEEIARIFKNDQYLTISFNKNQISIESDSTKFITRLVEGVFPDYEQIIPKSFDTEAIVKKEEILHQLKLSSVFTGRLNDISFFINPKEGKILLSVSNPDIGEHSSSLDAKIQGEEVELKFNWRYLMDGISCVNSEYVVLSLNNNQSPMLIKGKGDAAFLYLAMPMKGV